MVRPNRPMVFEPPRYRRENRNEIQTFGHLGLTGCSSQADHRREMSKENGRIHGGGVTEEQTNRISRNFRAAKALIDRKRPRNDAVSPDSHFLHSK